MRLEGQACRGGRTDVENSTSVKKGEHGPRTFEMELLRAKISGYLGYP